jgi:phage terminase Nu1 subunit (DNA packaging protein)
VSFPLDITDELLDALAEKVARHLRPRLLSKPALASLLGVEERTIKTWRSKGLPGHRVGREVMYDVREVERWVERNAA